MVIWLFVSSCVCVSVSLLRVVCYVYLYGRINICKSKKKSFCTFAFKLLPHGLALPFG